MFRVKRICLVLWIMVACCAAEAGEITIVKQEGRRIELSVPSENHPVPGPYRLDVVLPLDYEREQEAYRVLYVFDGHDISAALDALVQEDLAYPAILVAIHNRTYPARFYDMTPTSMSRYPMKSGGLEGLCHLIVDRVHPYLCDRLRVLPGAEHVGVMGNSLGGLAACWLGYVHPEHFGLVGGMQPSLWWDDDLLLKRMHVQTSEKTYQSFRLETHSPGGHSSLPEKDNAIYRLAAGLTRLAQFEFPYRFNETTQTFFGRLARAEQDPLAADMQAVANQPPDLAAAQRLAVVSPYYNSLLHTTAVATRLEAGHADNALPQSAHAIVNCRLFPGDTPAFVQQTLVQVLADPDIKVIPMGAGRPAPASPLVPDVMQAVERVTATMWPGLMVLPVMDPWTGDSKQLRRTGITTLGVSGIFGEMDFGNAHGANERLPAQS